MQSVFYLERLKGMLNEKRYRHSLGVRDMAIKMADIYGVDRNRAAVAGLLHDCARELSGDQLISIARKNSIIITKVEESLPVLLHAPVGAILANKKFHVDDEAILRSITLHTLGDCTMSLLDKIIFVADKIEPGRHYQGVEQLRDIARQDLDRALLRCLNAAARIALEREEPIHPRSINARNEILLKTFAPIK